MRDRQFTENEVVRLREPVWYGEDEAMPAGVHAVVLTAFGRWDDLSSCAYDLEFVYVNDGSSRFAFSVPHEKLERTR